MFCGISAKYSLKPVNLFDFMETVFSVLELVTLFAGLIYIFLQVKQNIWMWPVDILCCAAAIAVFFHQ